MCFPLTRTGERFGHVRGDHRAASGWGEEAMWKCRMDHCTGLLHPDDKRWDKDKPEQLRVSDTNRRAKCQLLQTFLNIAVHDHVHCLSASLPPPVAERHSQSEYPPGRARSGRGLKITGSICYAFYTIPR